MAPSIGWGVLHLLYRIDRGLAQQDPGAAKRIVDAIASLEDDGHRALTFVVLGHKADFGVMAYGPDLARLHGFQQEMLAGPVDPDFSYVSLTELSEYTASEDDEAARLRDEEGLTDPTEVAARLLVWNQRIEHYREQRLHPDLPARKVIGFYPMSKRRDGDDNWYRLPFEARKELMAGHAAHRPHLRGPGAAADHRLGRTRRLGVGGHLARRRPRRPQGDRVRDALRRRLGALRRVRALLHGARARARGCARPGRAVSTAGPSESVRLYVSFPEQLVDRPMIYEIVKEFDVVPNIRRGGDRGARRLGHPRADRTVGQRATRRSHTWRVSGARSTAWKAMSSRADAGDELPPDEAEARGLALLEQTGAAIVAGVAREAPGWAVANVQRLLDAWGAAEPAARAGALAAAPAAGRAATERVVASLQALLALDPGEQRSTPLEVVRTLYREPTAVLVDAGVPDVVRDQFAERSWPEDRYGLVPATLGDLGDPDLGPLHLAWGMAKAAVLRARARRTS